MNTDPTSPEFQELRQMAGLTDEQRASGQWTDLSDEDAIVLHATPKSERMTKLRELRPDLSHNQRKQTLNRRSLR